MQRCYRVAKSTKQLGENSAECASFTVSLNYDHSPSFSFEQRLLSRSYFKQITPELYLSEPHQDFFIFLHRRLYFFSFVLSRPLAFIRPTWMLSFIFLSSYTHSSNLKERMSPPECKAARGSSREK